MSRLKSDVVNLVVDSHLLFYHPLFDSCSAIYWTEWLRSTQQNARIGRALTDGTNITYVRAHQLGWPNGLALDPAAHRLWWCDAMFNR